VPEASHITLYNDDEAELTDNRADIGRFYRCALLPLLLNRRLSVDAETNWIVFHILHPVWQDESSDQPPVVSNLCALWHSTLPAARAHFRQ